MNNIKTFENFNNQDIFTYIKNNDIQSVKNYIGCTALIWAAYKNNREIVEILLDYGADEFILDNNNKSFYDYLNTENQQYFTQNYPTSVYNAISHWYKKSFTEFLKDYNLKK